MRILSALFLLLPGTLLAHGGGLDDRGGHTNTKTGQYHCHQQGCEGEPDHAGYDRDAWPHWRDTDGDCRDTRAEVLIRSSQVPVTYKDTQRCVVASGLWIDPYSGKTFRDASKLDIDHRVPLRHAHGRGADHWDRRRRAEFANDPDNLVPVSASANRSKGADGPGDWLPDNRDYWCEYRQRWLRIKQEYDLEVTTEGRKALKRLRQSCDDPRVTRTSE